jgi:hypothetical protein
MAIPRPSSDAREATIALHVQRSLCRRGRRPGRRVVPARLDRGPLWPLPADSMPPTRAVALWLQTGPANGTRGIAPPRFLILRRKPSVLSDSLEPDPSSSSRQQSPLRRCSEQDRTARRTALARRAHFRPSPRRRRAGGHGRVASAAAEASAARGFLLCAATHAPLPAPRPCCSTASARRIEASKTPLDARRARPCRTLDEPVPRPPATAISTASSGLGWLAALVCPSGRIALPGER